MEKSININCIINLCVVAISPWSLPFSDGSSGSLSPKWENIAGEQQK
jgi:hypothetical protein